MTTFREDGVLDPWVVPLSGMHVIEASAGTGKTFNITRLYARALLVRNLDIKSILVVTYTEAAKEELRGRIAEYLKSLERQLLAGDAGEFGEDVDRDLMRLCDSAEKRERARVVLAAAIQDMDVAEIHTIHGFCMRVLSEWAFRSGQPFRQNILEDNESLMLEAVRDHYRCAVEDPSHWLELREAWSTPEKCLKAVRGLLENPAIALPEPPATLLPKDLEDGKAACRGLLAEAVEAVEEALQRDNRSKTSQEFSAWVEAARALLQETSRDLDFVKRCRDLPMAPKARTAKAFKPLQAEQGVLSRWNEMVQAFKDNEKMAEECRLWHRVVGDVRQRLEQLRQRHNALDFSSMIHRVHDALKEDGSGELARMLGERYDLILVDEFQDTDLVQFEIFEAIHRAGGPQAGFFMIGDPKQAIYRFRGGDVHAYMEARRKASRVWSLNINHRSSPAMVRACNALFSRNAGALGEGIVYSEVGAKRADLSGPNSDRPSDTERAALHIPVFGPEDAQGNKRDIQQSIADWCAKEVRGLIGQTWQEKGALRTLRGKDIAFLVRSHDDAEIVLSALRRCGVAAASGKSPRTVFETAEAHALRLFLRGVLYAEREDFFLTALTSPWVGLSSPEIAAIKEQPKLWQAWFERMARWRELWLGGHLLSMLQDVFFMHYRLEWSHKHRSVTNIFHLAELLQRLSARQPSPEDQLAWLENQIANPSAGADARELRLDRDDDVVTVMTMHGSKGLQFPVVFLPFAQLVGRDKTLPSPFVIHHRGRLVAASKWDKPAVEQHKRENAEEDLRLFYVAMTRAKLRCYLPVVEEKNNSKSPLAVLCGKDGFRETLEEMAAQDPEAVVVYKAGDLQWKKAEAGESDGQPDARFEARQFTGHIDRDWRMLSFTAIARGAQSRLDASGVRDVDADRGDEIHDVPAVLPLRFRMQPGAQTGEFLHRLLEQVDFTRPDWGRLVNNLLPGSGLNENDSRELMTWLSEVLSAPIPLPEGPVTLNSLGLERTLREMEFYFPLQTSTRNVAAELARWRGEDNVALGHAHLKGMMRGFVDLVFEAHGKYWVADYKSTWLGPNLSDYNVSAMKRDMQEHHYDLQGLIYCVALHRLLRERLPDYRPERHLGGMTYLYLRGMHPGSGTGVHVGPVDPETLDRWDALFSQEVCA